MKDVHIWRSNDSFSSNLNPSHLVVFLLQFPFPLDHFVNLMTTAQSESNKAENCAACLEIGITSGGLTIACY